MFTAFQEFQIVREVTPRQWEGYDAIAQTRAAQDYIAGHRGSRPFLLALSWGPPHNPYQTAPQQYRDMFEPDAIKLRPNVPEAKQQEARADLAGYYTHIAALDDCVGEMLTTLARQGIEQDTIFVFWSDHGDMLGSQGLTRKQVPYDESILVPLLVRYPRLLGDGGSRIDAPINTPDIMPTLLGLAGLDIPASVEGLDWSGHMLGHRPAPADAALIACYHPFGERPRSLGGKEYRGVRTQQYTYVRDIEGPWLLFDNASDPCQMNNLLNRPQVADVQARLEDKLRELLKRTNDRFLPSEHYIRQWGYPTNADGTVPYTQ